MYSSRITHLRLAPKNIDYWDYTILCHGDDAVARVLQRFEYWDGTKAGGNVHGEEINEHLQASGYTPTQDVSRYVYKTIEELAWEMLGSVSERSLPKALDLLCDSLGYLKRRNNPYSTFDHTKQYEFQETLVVAHLGRLRTIVEQFLERGRQLRPVLYAIEQLTSKGVYVAHLTRQADGSVFDESSKPMLTIERVEAELHVMHTQLHETHPGKKKPTLPRFVRSDLLKDERRGFSATSDTPKPPTPPEMPPSQSTQPGDIGEVSRSGSVAATNTAEQVPSNRQNCCNSVAVLPQQRGNFAETIPVITPLITTTATAAGAADGKSTDQRAAPHAAAAAAASSLDIDTLSPEKIALIQAYRQQHDGQSNILEHEPKEASYPTGTGTPAVPPAIAQTGASSCPDEADTPSTQGHPEVAPPDEVTSLPVWSNKAKDCPMVPPGNANGAAPGPAAAIHRLSVGSANSVASSTSQAAAAPPTEQAASAPAPSVTESAPQELPTLSPETVVALFERKRGTHYDAVARPRQLAAARTLLELALPLELGKLERVYDHYHDDWWVAHYGDLHVSHLVEREKSGEIRIVRWLARMAPPARIAVTTASFSPKLAPLPHLLSLHPQIPLHASGGMQPVVAQALYEELRRDVRLALCKLALVPLADGTVALLVDYTVTSVVRQVAFYSPQQWQAKAATMTRCLDMFAPSDGTPALTTSERVAQLAQMMQARKGSNLYA